VSRAVSSRVRVCFLHSTSTRRRRCAARVPRAPPHTVYGFLESSLRPALTAASRKAHRRIEYVLHRICGARTLERTWNAFRRRGTGLEGTKVETRLRDPHSSQADPHIIPLSTCSKCSKCSTRSAVGDLLACLLVNMTNAGEGRPRGRRTCAPCVRPRPESEWDRTPSGSHPYSSMSAVAVRFAPPRVVFGSRPGSDPSVDGRGGGDPRDDEAERARVPTDRVRCARRHDAA
jgi:hypothetical protein